jgi:hypothetical protein
LRRLHAKPLLKDCRNEALRLLHARSHIFPLGLLYLACDAAASLLLILLIMMYKHTLH